MSAEAKPDAHAAGGKEKKTLIATLVGVTFAVIAFWVFFLVNGSTVPATINAAAYLVSESGRAIGAFGNGGADVAAGIHTARIGWTKVMIEITVFIMITLLVSWLVSKMLAGGIQEMKKAWSGSAAAAHH